MKRITIFVLMIFQFLGSCNSQKIDNVKDLSYRSGRLYIKDTSLYPPIFLRELRQMSSGFLEDTLKLIDSTIIQSRLGLKSRLPNHLRLNQKYSLKGEARNIKYSVSISRISLTEIRFDFEIMDETKSIHRMDGVAVLNPLFFLGQDQFEDDTTGLSFGMDDYEYNGAGCKLSVKVSHFDEGELKVILRARQCKVDSTYLFTDSPILRWRK